MKLRPHNESANFEDDSALDDRYGPLPARTASSGTYNGDFATDNAYCKGNVDDVR